MSTRRAKQHQEIVANKKAVRHLMHYKTNHNIIYFAPTAQRINGPRWRAINRVQTARERMASELMHGYEFTREETELAIKILEGEKHDN